MKFGVVIFYFFPIVFWTFGKFKFTECDSAILPQSYGSPERVRSLGDGVKTSIEIFIVFQKVLVHTK